MKHYLKLASCNIIDEYDNNGLSTVIFWMIDWNVTFDTPEMRRNTPHNSYLKSDIVLVLLILL